MQPDTEIRTEPTDPRQDLVIRCPATGEVVGSGTDDAGCRARRSPAGWRWTVRQRVDARQSEGDGAASQMDTGSVYINNALSGVLQFPVPMVGTWREDNTWPQAELFSNAGGAGGLHSEWILRPPRSNPLDRRQRHGPRAPPTYAASDGH